MHGRKVWWAIASVVVGMAVARCGSKSGRDDQNPVEETPFDAAELAGLDTGLPDAQPPDAGVPDASPQPPAPNEAQGFTSYTAAHGLPLSVRDVSADSAGNVWVAGADALYLLKPGAVWFQKLGVAEGLAAYRVLSVAGMGAGEVWVGYEGLFAGKEDNDPPEILRSGGVHHLRLVGDLVEGTRYEIGTPPGDPMFCDDPQYRDSVCLTGRYKLRTVFVIRPNRNSVSSGDVWFGATHGVALWDESRQAIVEHAHSAIYGPDKNGYYTHLSGDHWGLAFDADGNPWIGGAHREAHMPYSSLGFTERFDTILDTWPDKDEVNRTDDHVSSMAVDSAGKVWIGSIVNSLARYDPTTASFEYFTPSNGLPDKAVLALAADPDGTIWVGTYVGLHRYDPTARTWRSYYWRTVGLPNDEIHSLQIDRRTAPRTLYIGTQGGVSIYRGP
ncbi:MAG: hypothetical protein HY901_12355 [Deltaproteobacteria bacterium]|nr:hypothetical protein [Deltaproteobacteria bacterium]